MFTIRREQVDSFRKAAIQEFEDEMVEHLKQFARRHWQIIGEPAGREVIRMGIDRAAKYGFTNRGPVRFYIELMFMFGSYFDTDPQYPWAGTILKSSGQMNQMDYADRLYDAMNGYLECVSGPKHEYLQAATRRLSCFQIEDCAVPEEALHENLLRALKTIYPQKHAYLGDAILNKVIAQGFQLASSHGLLHERGKVLMVALTFSVGHGFPTDPLYGWISRRLDQGHWPNPIDRTEHLYRAAVTYLKHVTGKDEKE